jgi:hypothetical protein
MIGTTSSVQATTSRLTPDASTRAVSLPRPQARPLTSGLAWSGAVSIALIIWILYALGGREYYATPLTVRAYAAGHRLLRPSGPGGQMFGIAGALLMLMPFLYMARKRITWLKGIGRLTTWLEIHLFCGVVGPVLITFHTSFKFNGIVSAAYWSMVVVVASGFVGRYLYVRIPRSIRGTELTRAQIVARADRLKIGLEQSIRWPSALARLESIEQTISHRQTLSLFDLVSGDIRLGRRYREFERELQRAGVPPDRSREIARLAVSRSTLLRRLAYLEMTKKLFALWHAFHLPLVYLLWLIVAAHVAITLYMGYVPFHW